MQQNRERQARRRRRKAAAGGECTALRARTSGCLRHTARIISSTLRDMATTALSGGKGEARVLRSPLPAAVAACLARSVAGEVRAGRRGAHSRAPPRGELSDWDRACGTQESRRELGEYEGRWCRRWTGWHSAQELPAAPMPPPPALAAVAACSPPSSLSRRHCPLPLPRSTIRPGIRQLEGG
jgi:hypothetical protein